jgi:hypothetical protein
MTPPDYDDLCKRLANSAATDIACGNKDSVFALALSAIKAMREQVAELDWVKTVIARHGYDGPLAPACCPLEDWLKAEADNAALLSAVRRAMAYCDEESRGVYNTLDSAIAAQEKDAMREGKE